MSTKSKSIASKTDFNQDERLQKVSKLKILLNRPELGALGGAILVFIFFGIVAGDTGMFSAYGILNFLDVSANLGTLRRGWVALRHTAHVRNDQLVRTVLAV